MERSKAKGASCDCSSGKTGHIAAHYPDCKHRPAAKKEKSVNAVEDWIVDSAAFSHIITNKDSLVAFKAGKGGIPKEVLAAINEPDAVQGEGTAIVKSSEGEIKLTHVLYMPTSTRNSISVGCLADEGKAVLFTKQKCEIWDNIIDKKVLATGIKTPSNGLYKLIKPSRRAPSLVLKCTPPCVRSRLKSTKRWPRSSMVVASIIIALIALFLWHISF